MPEKEKKPVQDKEWELVMGVELELLSILWSSDSYGLEILEKISQASGDRRKLNLGSLYPTLHKMLRKGYIDSYIVNPEKSVGVDGKKTGRRKFYSLTEKGKTRLLDTWQYLSHLTANEKLIKVSRSF